MALLHTVNRLADAITAAPPVQRFALLPGVISAVDVGGAVDGSDIATVTVGADTIQAPCIGYLPTVGDAVRVLLVDSSPLILGPVTGVPT